MDKKKKGFNQRGKKNAKGKSTLSDEIVRQVCDCEATKHPLVNNCLNCGRIVCLNEGPGPCFCCGNIVGYNNEPLPPIKFTKDSDIKHRKISEVDPSETLKLRDRLLEFDKNCAIRTSVIDDECDYYQANNTWLSKSEREKWEKLESSMYEEKHKSRLLQTLKMDFTGRVTTEKDDVLDLFHNMNSIKDERNFETNSPYQTNQYESLKGPVYLNAGSMPSNISDKEQNNNANNRIQDKGILEISDQGVCLSMHQPYASLLVRGIKTTEGRTWYTSHRGRLWIASTAKEPHAEEIAAIEATYKHLYDDENIQFPKNYPTGCLLGCVTVTDVLSQEEYNKLHPDNYLDSPYIFICENFFELPMRYPIQGKHKIYKLDSVIHRAALNCLEKTCMQMAKNAVK